MSNFRAFQRLEAAQSQRLEAATGYESSYSFRSALDRKNVRKNRYRDILPFDRNRVRLAAPDDYINASHIDNGSLKWIATQGPLDQTVGDFWKLMIDQSSTIVMLCGIVEDGRPKCAAYFPLEVGEILRGTSNSNTTNWQVTCHHKQSDKDSGAVIRTLLLELRNGEATSTSKTINHIHFETWPDHEATTIEQLIFLLRRTLQIHNESSQNSDPIVVHCSAGCGRTGTFIALQALEASSSEDVSKLVDNLRKQRIASVQSLAQFDLLCDYASLAQQRKATHQLR